MQKHLNKRTIELRNNNTNSWLVTALADRMYTIDDIHNA